ncbi:hypothetical protein FRX31_012352 [Thalictrum thalictroides]|uniref:Uncharacterized protein n=1 Tax=Thalictrum thalictroides TaxID=46969 RepID=A0A7J6WL05_THATH|nr:hypothetical protein FRX31_012352 [Thalictrum thalictroides]
MGLHDMRLDDWVLCKIHEKDGCTVKKKDTKVMTNKRRKNGCKKKNDEDEPMEVDVPKKNPSNSNPMFSLLDESNDNQWSSVEFDNEPVFDVDEREHLMAICACMGISDLYSEYFLENHSYLFKLLNYFSP